MARAEPVSDQPRRGRPAIGTRHLVVLDAEAVATLTALGRGNLSAGIREAARLIAQQPRPSPSR